MSLCKRSYINTLYYNIYNWYRLGIDRQDVLFANELCTIMIIIISIMGKSFILHHSVSLLYYTSSVHYNITLYYSIVYKIFFHRFSFCLSSNRYSIYYVFYLFFYIFLFFFYTKHNIIIIYEMILICNEIFTITFKRWLSNYIFF